MPVGMNHCRQTLREYLSAVPSGWSHQKPNPPFLAPPLPRASRKEGHYRWSARWTGQGRLPFAPKTGRRLGWVAEINHEIALLPASFWSGWPDLNRRPLRPELSAQLGKSAG